jgi:acyl-CoA synthetase (AMP-forming)/AMP-acid ligase II
MAVVGSKQRRESPDSIALRDERVAVTWLELDDLLNRATNALLGMDLGSDRRIGVFAENTVNTVIAYLAGVLSSCSGVPINYHLRAQECAYILRDSDAALLLVGPENVDRGLEAARLAGGTRVLAWGASAA